MNGMRKLIINLWLLIDPLYYRCTRLTYIGKYRKYPSNIFRVRLTKYKGRKVTLQDGTIIQKNDLLLKIHLHNARLLHELFHVNSDVKKAFQLYQWTKESLPGLATYLLTHKHASNIKGAIGITTLNRGVARLGFEAIPIKNKWYKLMKMITFFPIHLLSLTKPNVKDLRKHLEPEYIFITKEKLLSKYVQPPLGIRKAVKSEQNKTS